MLKLKIIAKLRSKRCKKTLVDIAATQKLESRILTEFQILSPVNFIQKKHQAALINQ